MIFFVASFTNTTPHHINLLNQQLEKHHVAAAADEHQRDGKGSLHVCHHVIIIIRDSGRKIPILVLY